MPHRLAALLILMALAFVWSPGKAEAHAGAPAGHPVAAMEHHGMAAPAAALPSPEMPRDGGRHDHDGGCCLSPGGCTGPGAALPMAAPLPAPISGPAPASTSRSTSLRGIHPPTEDRPPRNA